MRFEKATEPQIITFTITATAKELEMLYSEFMIMKLDHGEFKERFPMSYSLLENFPTANSEFPVEFSLDD